MRRAMIRFLPPLSSSSRHGWWSEQAWKTFCAALVFITSQGGLALAQNEPAHYGIAMHGAPALPPDFDHLPYANPQAPKGGVLHIGFQGTFDSLNPFNLRAGSTAQGLADRKSVV